METIKVIDLLNKIANGEEVPKKIIYKGKVREFVYEDKDYTCISDTDYYLFHDTLAEGTGDKMVTELNDEVEIIEEVPKKIEQIGKSYNIRKIQSESQTYYYDMNQLIDMVQDIYDKQREIINKINGE